ncbi:MAG: hypothetical protein ABI690_32885 [Chloroflexota bacterium]
MRLGKVVGLLITANRNVFYGFGVLWIVVVIGVIFLLDVPFGEAIIGGFILTLLHYLSELWHQLGHAWAARRVGYPMIGVRYWWILATSIYPNNEPELPGSTHIKRALGGPGASILLTFILFILTIVINRFPGYSLLLWVLPLLTLDNLFFFTLGAFLPLGFTDGSTILRWLWK